MTVLLFVTLTTSKPAPLSQAEVRSGVGDPAGTCIFVSVMDCLEGVILPVRPLTVIIGVHEAKRGTFNVRLTEIVLLSQGYGEDCVIFHLRAPAVPTLNPADRTKRGNASSAEANAGPGLLVS